MLSFCKLYKTTFQKSHHSTITFSLILDQHLNMAPWLSNNIITRVCLAIDPPAIREDQGDILVRLSERPEDHLLLKSSSLKECTEWFQHHTEWESYGGPIDTTTIVDPVTMKHVTIYNYYMSGFLEGGKAVWLIHNDVSSDSSDSAPCLSIRTEDEYHSYRYTYSGPIIDTDLTTNFVDHTSNQQWSWIYDEWNFPDISNGYETAINEYKTLFRFMFGLDPCLAGKKHDLPAIATWPTNGSNEERTEAHAHLCEPGDDYDEICWAVTLIHAEHFANVAVRADYHNCLPAIAPHLISVLMALPRLWEAIAEEPRWWIGLALLLRAEDIYTECLRHLVGSCCLKCQDLPDCQDLDIDNLRYRIYRLRDPLIEANNKLHLQLDRLSLSPYTVYHPWEKKDSPGEKTLPVLWYHLQSLFLKPRRDPHNPRPPKKSWSHRVDFLARSIFAQRIKDLHQTQLSKRPGDGPSRWNGLWDCCQGIAGLKFYG
jgi:hypothetical protein